jgi:hypothetical protein
LLLLSEYFFLVLFKNILKGVTDVRTPLLGTETGGITRIVVRYYLLPSQCSFWYSNWWQLGEYTISFADESTIDNTPIKFFPCRMPRDNDTINYHVPEFSSYNQSTTQAKHSIFPRKSSVVATIPAESNDNGAQSPRNSRDVTSIHETTNHCHGWISQIT